MLTTSQRLQYIDALEHVSKLRPYYRTSKQLLVLIKEYGYYYENVDEKAVPVVQEKYKKSNWVFAVLERYVKIATKYKVKFDHKFFDHYYVQLFNMPKHICEMIEDDYKEIMRIDHEMKLMR